MSERFYPKEENLGESCMFWGMGESGVGCNYPKVEVFGRLSCEGVIDDVCLYLTTGRTPSSLTDEQILEIKTHVPTLSEDKSYLPPGETTP
jgi:hypothetical protein